MRYSEKYNQFTKKEFHLAELESSIMYYHDHKGECFICKALTNFYEVNFQTWICSEECLKEIDNRFNEAMKNGIAE